MRGTFASLLGQTKKKHFKIHIWHCEQTKRKQKINNIMFMVTALTTESVSSTHLPFGMGTLQFCCPPAGERMQSHSFGREEPAFDAWMLILAAQTRICNELPVLSLQWEC